MGCGAEATGLGFVCFVVINPCVLSANRVDFGVFHKFSKFTPTPIAPNSDAVLHFGRPEVYHCLATGPNPHRMTTHGRSIPTLQCSASKALISSSSPWLLRVGEGGFPLFLFNLLKRLGFFFEPSFLPLMFNRVLACSCF